MGTWTSATTTSAGTDPITDVPSGATAVSVSAGATSGINAALATAGGVTGTVDDASSHPLDGVNVEIFSPGGSYAGAATTGPSGTYSVPGLMTGTYDVCFLASTASEPTGGSSTTGYLDQCYNDVSWNGTSSPSGTTAVEVEAGSNTVGINAALATAGGISGTVDDASSHPLDGVAVDVYSAGGSEVGYGTTGSNGTYAVQGLTTGTYDVCFAASTYGEPTGGSSATGYLDQCYKNVSWDGSTSEASGATAIEVTAGSNTSGINAALASGGAILGTVDDASSHPLSGVEVEVYSASGAEVRYAEHGLERDLLGDRTYYGHLRRVLQRVHLQSAHRRLVDHRLPRPVLQQCDLERELQPERSDRSPGDGRVDQDQHQWGARRRRCRFRHCR